MRSLSVSHTAVAFSLDDVEPGEIVSTTPRSSPAYSPLAEISGNRGGPQTSPTPATEHINDKYTDQTDSSHGKHTGATKVLEELLSNPTAASPYTRTRTTREHVDWWRTVQEEHKLADNNAREGLIIRGSFLFICRNKTLIRLAHKAKAKEPCRRNKEDERILEIMDHNPLDGQWYLYKWRYWLVHNICGPVALVSPIYTCGGRGLKTAGYGSDAAIVSLSDRASPKGCISRSIESNHKPLLVKYWSRRQPYLKPESAVLLAESMTIYMDRNTGANVIGRLGKASTAAMRSISNSLFRQDSDLSSESDFEDRLPKTRKASASRHSRVGSEEMRRPQASPSTPDEAQLPSSAAAGAHPVRRRQHTVESNTASQETRIITASSSESAAASGDIDRQGSRGTKRFADAPSLSAGPHWSTPRSQSIPQSSLPEPPRKRQKRSDALPASLALPADAAYVHSSQSETSHQDTRGDQRMRAT